MAVQPRCLNEKCIMKKDGRIQMPVLEQAHHSFVDGLQVGN